MIVRFNLDHKVFEKIKKLIDEGVYPNEQEFLRMAINSQLEVDSDQASKPDLELVLSDKTGQMESIVHIETKTSDVLKNWDYHTFIEQLEKHYIETKNEKKFERYVPRALYGPASTGLIWIFHNRFLPIKVIVTELAHIISEKKSQWIDLDEFKDGISELAIEINAKLQEMKVKDNDINLSVGFPVSLGRLRRRHGNRLLRKIRGKANKEAWLVGRFNSGKRRFADQFICRPIKKYGKSTFSGACVEMDLISVVNDNGWKITLTENGRKFASMNNPVLKIISSDVGTNFIETVFSKDEFDFIMEKIIPYFSLEEIIINNIMNLPKDTVLSVDDVKHIFKKEKSRYLENVYTARKLKEFEDKYKDKMSSDGYTDIIKWLTEKYLPIQIASTLRRLAELGVVKLEIDHNVPRYTLLQIKNQ